ncbi:MAG: hypothetical protein M1355_04245 [Patescibacteria group bacterium]|nr:hypothetical protein [Patescibacteria group bacterium]
MPDNGKLYRFLETLPGTADWITLLLPFILAPFLPFYVACFILIFNLYWLFKAINLMRHLYHGYYWMKKYMRANWYDRCEKVGDKKTLLDHLKRNQKDRDCKKDIETISSLKDFQKSIKKVEDIYHVVLFAVSSEGIDIVEPSVKAILTSNYPAERVFVILACEERMPQSVEVAKALKKKYSSKFYYFDYYIHPDGILGEVRGKGPNFSWAGKRFLEYLKENEKIPFDNILVTNLDADHILHKEYLARLSYRYIIDPYREYKTYQPVPLLFNNIWDTPAMNRLAAIGSSFWQIVESMRPYRMRTFAAHSQSLPTLIKTDFWALHSIVEDGHQFWRTYFVYNGRIKMEPLLIPVYQDAVLAETRWKTFKSQYVQRRRWAWGASDFPFIVTNFLKHKEIPWFEKTVQTFRHFAGGYSWATASFLIAGAWIPLLFNRAFQDTVIAHNVTAYAVMVARFAWIGIFANVWVYLSLLPPRPTKYGPMRHVSMVLQFILSPVVAIILSSLPALDSQTRLMLGKRLEWWITPKVRRA